MEEAGTNSYFYFTGKACWKHIVKVAEEDQKEIFNNLGHITKDHLNPSGAASMKVKLAAYST